MYFITRFNKECEKGIFGVAYGAIYSTIFISLTNVYFSGCNFVIEIIRAIYEGEYFGKLIFVVVGGFLGPCLASIIYYRFY